MRRKEFRFLISVEEALEKLYRYYKPKPLGVEEVSIEHALGRVLAEDAQALIDVPHFDRASMDGYAVIAADTLGADEWNPVRLKLIGRIEAGTVPDIEVINGKAVEIATGAVMPKGADAVVIVEHTRETNGFVEIYTSVAPGDNVYKAGSDISFGEVILKKGIVLGYREIGVLASLGYEKVKVYVKPKVAIISTGNELVKP
ncbi:MAG: molybdopterin biosynthesis protein, partial [Thermoprotei archaeon]